MSSEEVWLWISAALAGDRSMAAVRRIELNGVVGVVILVLIGDYLDRCYYCIRDPRIKLSKVKHVSLVDRFFEVIGCTHLVRSMLFWASESDQHG